MKEPPIRLTPTQQAMWDKIAHLPQQERKKVLETLKEMAPAHNMRAMKVHANSTYAIRDEDVEVGQVDRPPRSGTYTPSPPSQVEAGGVVLSEKLSR